MDEKRHRRHGFLKHREHKDPSRKPRRSPSPPKTGTGIQRLDELTGGVLPKGQTEAAREHREAELEESQRIARIGSWEWTVATGVVAWSDGLNHLLGRAHGSAPPTFETLPQFYTAESWQRLGTVIARAVETGASYDLEVAMIRADGATCWTTTRGEAIRGTDGTVVKLRGTVHDITELKLAEGTLRLQSAALNAVANTIIITDRRGNMVWANPAFTTLTGYTVEEAIGKNMRELAKSGAHDRAFYKRLWDTIVAGDVWSGTITNRRKDGSPYPEELTITPLKDDRGDITHFIALKWDLTSERALQAQFLQSQKMETVGRLAAGIAHDFNNLLTVINGTADLALTTSKEGDPLHAELRDMRQAGERAALLTRQLLAFSRQQVMQFETLNLSTLVANLHGMLQRLIGEDIALVATPAKEVSSVNADPVQIEQVIMNLAVNARDAMPYGGTLTVETASVELDEAYAAEHPSVRPGPYVMLAISDTGVGMNEATRARIFEPFFTTKGPGKGTGLGLSTVYGIVAQSGGTIWVYSEPRKGTTFKVYLPRVDAVPKEGKPVANVTSARGTETVLVVEDDAAVCHLAKRILELAGYTVLTAGNGEEALALLERHEGAVHLMITDMVMPGMSGRDLAVRLQDIRPRMKVIFTSGYTADSIPRSGRPDEVDHFIGKPYAPAQLTRALREVLDSEEIQPTAG